ncbi:tumor necrosis factor ligand superfamily member 10-like [Lingula anatina]|uniref:Tumor necrosis factor ligand superfamily member 10-like n=1 Tax=Lingula anatina TaxID=7574 RepID=A0A1S3I348_LINAN|nr:tumor necrosis factor ligand superfamily member 10-like [Lingula anatina]|eukprot:XP_013392658.1 tumor necrosis factor ligand superfamily member 10-like [Lingula anatina]
MVYFHAPVPMNNTIFFFPFQYVDVKIQQAEEDRSFRQPPSSNTLKSSAHLILNPTVDLAAEGSTSKTMKHWLYNDAAAHLFNVAFIPSTGHIRIKHTGKYFLYTRASVLFKASNDPPLIHSVHKKSASSALRELLRAVRINRWSSALRYDVQTSFLSGTFDLRENDEVYVSLNNIARLYFSERNYRSTNFGLFMI